MSAVSGVDKVVVMTLDVVIMMHIAIDGHTNDAWLNGKYKFTDVAIKSRL